MGRVNPKNTKPFVTGPICIRNGCVRTHQAGSRRCSIHENEVLRKRKKHEDPLVKKVAEAHRVGGFTPAVDPGKISRAFFEDIQKAGSLDETKTYQQHFSDVALEKNLYAGDPVFDKMKKLFDKQFESMQTAEAKEAARRLLSSTPEQLGNAARLAASGVNTEERNLVLRLAQDQFKMGNYEAEQLLRGLLVRSDRVKQAEDDATRRYRQAMDATARGDTLQRQVDSQRTVIDDKERQIAQLEERERTGYWRTLAEERAAELQKLKHPTWTTAKGEVLRPDQFVDAHLLNTVRFIENLEPDIVYTDYDGDAAGADEIVVDRGPDTVPVYPLLLKEARKRKLLICKDRVKLKPAEIVEFEE